MGEIANLLGWLIIGGYALALLNYPIRWANKKWVSKLHRDSSFKRLYLGLMRLIILYHRWFAILATAALVIHAVLQFLYRWPSSSGLIAAGFMVLNVIIGAYGLYIRKSKRTLWFVFHRAAAVLLIAAILYHLI